MLLSRQVQQAPSSFCRSAGVRFGSIMVSSLGTVKVCMEFLSTLNHLLLILRMTEEDDCGSEFGG